jgi:hypothetical protein
MNIVKHRSVHSGRLERWMGSDKISNLGKSMKDWYGPPIHILDVPGSVRMCKDGDFIGPFERGVFFSALDVFESAFKRAAKVPPGTLYAGFSNISDALSRASQGFRQSFNGNIQKAGPTGVANVTSTLWRLGAAPAAGSAGAAAPGGTAHTSADTGAMVWNNPSAGTMRLTGADMSASVNSNCLLLYDRLFSVAKTMNSSATEAVTGVPTRYQSSTPTSEEYIGGNFLFVEVGGTALAATGHNWTVCTYTDDANNATQTLPSLTGNSGAIVDRLDHPANQFFAPLATGDVGIKLLSQMQCSAAVATGLINFVIGHPIGFMAFPIANMMTPFDWITNRDQAPYISNSACLALLEVVKPSTTATSYTGRIYGTSTSS